MTISDEAVEAAAKYMAANIGYVIDDDGFRLLAKYALEAAAPHMHARTLAYLDEAVRLGSIDPDVKDYERGFDDATRGMAAKVKRLLNGEAQ